MAQTTVKIKRLILFCLLALVIGLVIGVFLPEREIKEKSKYPDECIPIPEVVSYPHGGPLRETVYVEQVLPLKPWQVVLDLGIRRGELHVFRTTDDSEEVWLSAWDDQEEVYVFNVYNLTTKQWSTYPQEIIYNGESIFINQVYFSKSGTIFGIPKLNPLTKMDLESVPLISVFQPETNKFEFQKPIPITSDNLDYTEVTYDSYQEVFWIITSEKTLYRYDPITQDFTQQELYLDTDVFLPLEIIVDDQGILHILSLSIIMPTTNKDIQYVRYDPVTQDQLHYRQLNLGFEIWPIAIDIFAAQSGAIWFGGVGWAEPSGEWLSWFQLVPSPLFYLNNRFSGLDWTWYSPSIEVESNDGRLWMVPPSHYNGDGMAWFDPEEERWCWFTTAISNIEKDEAGNLWMVADGKLYRYPFED